jgi:hypothetical protein
MFRGLFEGALSRSVVEKQTGKAFIVFENVDQLVVDGVKDMAKATTSTLSFLNSKGEVRNLSYANGKGVVQQKSSVKLSRLNVIKE